MLLTLSAITIKATAHALNDAEELQFITYWYNSGNRAAGTVPCGLVLALIVVKFLRAGGRVVIYQLVINGVFHDFFNVATQVFR